MKTAQVRITKAGVGEGLPGTIIWATAERALQLMAAARGELVNAGYVPRDAGILHRSLDWPLNRFSSVRADWTRQGVILIGGGPSLTTEQVEQAKLACLGDRFRCIAINDAYLWADWADILYAADSGWWADHARGVPKPRIGLSAPAVRERFEAFQGDRCSIGNSGISVEDPRVHLLRNAREDPNGNGIHAFGLSSDPGAVVTGRHSGFQALNVAVLAGAKRVILIGFDGQRGADGRTHWSGGHPQSTPETAWEQYRRSFSVAERDLDAAGVEVLNCSPGSAIESFPKVTLAEALQ